MVAVSAALTISGIPFMGPIGAARVGYIDGEYVLNPMLDQMDDSALDLVVAGTGDAVLMVESEAQELAEEVMLGAVMFGHAKFQPVIEAIIGLAEKCAKRAAYGRDSGSVRISKPVSVRSRRPICARLTPKPIKSTRQDMISAARDKVYGRALP